MDAHSTMDTARWTPNEVDELDEFLNSEFPDNDEPSAECELKCIDFLICTGERKDAEPVRDLKDVERALLMADADTTDARAVALSSPSPSASSATTIPPMTPPPVPTTPAAPPVPARVDEHTVLEFVGMPNPDRYFDTVDAGQPIVSCGYVAPLTIRLMLKDSRSGQLVPGVFEVEQTLVFANDHAPVPAPNLLPRFDTRAKLSNGVGKCDARIEASSNKHKQRCFQIRYAPADAELAARFPKLTIFTPTPLKSRMKLNAAHVNHPAKNPVNDDLEERNVVPRYRSLCCPMQEEEEEAWEEEVDLCTYRSRCLNMGDDDGNDEDDDSAAADDDDDDDDECVVRFRSLGVGLATGDA